MSQTQNLESQIINYMIDNPKELGIRTIDIAKAIFGKDATKKLVNPAMYKLGKEGKIKRIGDINAADPRWVLNQ